MKSSYKDKLSVLKEILKLTKKDLLKWECIETDTRYVSVLNQYKFEVEFIRLLKTDETGSDKMIASIFAINQTLDYAIGTKGFDIIIEIIAISQTNWKPSWELGSKKISEIVKLLKKINLEA